MFSLCQFNHKALMVLSVKPGLIHIKHFASCISLQVCTTAL